MDGNQACATRCTLGLGSIRVDEEVLWVVDKSVRKVMWDFAASSFFCCGMWTDTRRGSGGSSQGGLAEWSSCSSWVEDGVRSAMLLWIRQSCECRLSMVSQSFW